MSDLFPRTNVEVVTHVDRCRIKYYSPLRKDQDDSVEQLSRRSRGPISRAMCWSLSQVNTPPRTADLPWSVFISHGDINYKLHPLRNNTFSFHTNRNPMSCSMFTLVKGFVMRSAGPYRRVKIFFGTDLSRSECILCPQMLHVQILCISQPFRPTAQNADDELHCI